MIRVAVFGATGYTGLELVGILARHPAVEIRFLVSGSQAGRSLRSVHPAAPDLPLVGAAEAPLGAVDAVFLCLPHGQSARTAAAALQAGARVIDLSADYRLRDAAEYEAWYQAPHPHPELLSEAVYGLTEACRAYLPEARLVANPGCYPTSILLPLWPLLEAGALTGTVIADSKSGVSGAGRVPKVGTLYAELAENFYPYGIGQTHRHWPEMRQEMNGWSAAAPELVFAPHLLPVTRGMLSTLHLELAAGWDLDRARLTLESRYATEAFVRVLPPGEAASLAHVARTNRCVIGVHAAGPANRLVLTSALDNLVKGASGQAVQNFNVMFGLPETQGLVA
ncbi:MAG TPA: N-acetyl-gamma-glutamyl-phosphate reductase [Anaerolineae bacterium]|nr:N-acetyl-gamma-glutamyl-phosphate reductase [Anaerolineae bacterium]